jgi:DNA-binding MarR family transcriptional regulator
MVISKKMRRYIPSSEEFCYEEFPFYWLARVQGIYTQQMEKALKKIGTDIPSWRILFILKEHGKCSISEISDHSIIKLSTVTRIVYRMKAEGLIETNTHAKDGRVTEVSLNEKGHDLIIQVQKSTEKIFTRSFAGFNENQLLKLNQMLEQLYKNLAED